MDAPAPVPARLLVTGIHEQAMEPDVEAFGIAEPRKVAPGEEECLLDGVTRPFAIAKDPIRDGVAPAAVEVDELGEGDVVAPTSPFDQPRPHWRISRRRPHFGRFEPYRRCDPRKSSREDLESLAGVR
jgi:hypothetical protein